MSKKLSPREREELYRNVAIYIGALDLSLANALRQMVSVAESIKKHRRPIIRVAREWRASILDGAPDATYPALFGASASEVAIIAAGSLGGTNLSETYQSAQQMASRQKSSMGKLLSLVLPALLAFAGGPLAFWGLSNGFLPSFTALLPVEEWPPAAAALYNARGLFAPLMFLVLGVIFVLVLVHVHLLRNGLGPWRVWADEYYPPFKLYRLTGAVSFFRAYAQLTQGTSDPISPLKAIEHLHEGTPSLYLRDRLARLVPFMKEGSNFGHAAYKTGKGWPDKAFIADFVALSANPSSSSGKNIMQSIIQLWQEKGETSFNLAIATGKTLLTLIFWVQVFVVLLIAGPLFLTITEHMQNL